MRFCKKNIHISKVINTSLSLTVSVMSGSRSGRWRRMSALCDYWWTWRENKTKRRSRIRSTYRGFVKKIVWGFWYKPRGDWFSFAKVRKLCFLCSCKQTRETTCFTGACATHTSYVIRRNGFRVQQIPEVRDKCLLCLKYVYFSYKKAWTDNTWNSQDNF